MAGPELSDPRSGARLASQGGSGWRLAAILAVEALFLGGLLLLSACYSPAGKLTGFDLVALPGERIDLEAKIEHDGPGFLNHDISGVEILFGRGAPPAGAEAAAASGEALLGSAKSDGDGMARLSLAVPRDPGDHAFWVALKEPRRIRLTEWAFPLTVSVISPDQPILVTDIDDTISRTRMGPVLADRPEEVPPLPGAVPTLKEAAGKYRIIYLTARSSYLARRTRRWLETHGFPGGAMVQRDLWAEWRHLDFKEDEFKAKAIADLKSKKRFTEIRWGIGNRIGDGEAYARNGIRAILIGVDPKEVPERHRDRIQTVENWDQVRKLILP